MEQEGNSKDELNQRVSAAEEIVAPKVVIVPITKNPKRPTRLLILIIAVGILTAGGYTFFSNSGVADNDKIQAKVAMTEQELKDVIAAKHLIVYWAGPLEGAKYTLTATTPGIVYLKYIPGGVSFSDPKIYFRTVGTYAVPNAFVVTQSTGAKQGSVGFTNADGYAVFYSLSRPTNIYMGIKKIDIQVEIFDPRADQALALVSVQGQFRRIT